MREERAFYSVVAYVPDEAREERVNLGVVVVSPGPPFAGALFTGDLSRARAIDPGIDVAMVRRALRQWEQLFSVGGDESLLDAPGWSVPHHPTDPRSLEYVAAEYYGQVQFARPRPCHVDRDLPGIVRELYEAYVSPPPRLPRRERLTPTSRRLTWVLRSRGLLDARQIEEAPTLEGKSGKRYVLDYGFRNGRLHAVQAVNLGAQDGDGRALQAMASAFDLKARTGNGELFLAVVYGGTNGDREASRVRLNILREGQFDEWLDIDRHEGDVVRLFEQAPKADVP